MRIESIVKFRRVLIGTILLFCVAEVAMIFVVLTRGQATETSTAINDEKSDEDLFFLGLEKGMHTARLKSANEDVEYKRGLWRIGYNDQDRIALEQAMRERTSAMDAIIDSSTNRRLFSAKEVAEIMESQLEHLKR